MWPQLTFDISWTLDHLCAELQLQTRHWARRTTWRTGLFGNQSRNTDKQPVNQRFCIKGSWNEIWLELGLAFFRSQLRVSQRSRVRMWIFSVFVQVLTPASDNRSWRCGCVGCQCWWTPWFQSRSTVGTEGDFCVRKVTFSYVTAARLLITRVKSVEHFLLTIPKTQVQVSCSSTFHKENKTSQWCCVSKPRTYIFNVTVLMP